MNPPDLQRRLARIRDRQRRRRRNPTPEQVWECIEDVDTLLEVVRRLMENGEEKNN